MKELQEIFAALEQLKNSTKIGERLLLGSDTIINHISDEELAAEVLSDTQAALRHKTSVGKQ